MDFQPPIESRICIDIDSVSPAGKWLSYCRAARWLFYKIVDLCLMKGPATFISTLQWTNNELNVGRYAQKKKEKKEKKRKSRGMEILPPPSVWTWIRLERGTWKMEQSSAIAFTGLDQSREDTSGDSRRIPMAFQWHFNVFRSFVFTVSRPGFSWRFSIGALIRMKPSLIIQATRSESFNSDTRNNQSLKMGDPSGFHFQHFQLYSRSLSICNFWMLSVRPERIDNFHEKQWNVVTRYLMSPLFQELQFFYHHHSPTPSTHKDNTLS